MTQLHAYFFTKISYTVKPTEQFLLFAVFRTFPNSYSIGADISVLKCISTCFSFAHTSKLRNHKDRRIILKHDGNYHTNVL